MKALILAGGFGIRLREIIHGRPKCLALVNGRSFLRYPLALLKRNGITEVVISVGYLARQVRDEFTHDDEGLSIAFSEDDYPLGTGGSIKKAQSFFTEDFLIMNGDTYLDIDYGRLFSAHRESGAVLTIVATDKHKEKGGIVMSENGRAFDFISDPDASVSSNGFRNAGVYVASPNIFEHIIGDGRVSLERETIPSLFAKGEPVGSFNVSQSFIDIGSPSGYLEACNAL
jgi:NDP-sugar pyrophosphorylase family protein